jgi:CRISPR-associated endonuclease/helicase Cas3
VAYYAHTPAVPGGSWHDLGQHLRSVAELAAEFSASFGARDAGFCAGLLHDVGKFQPSFQDYLRACYEHGGAPPRRGPDHSSAGAVLAMLADLWELAFAIAGHHAGLPSTPDLKARLQERAAEDEVQHALHTALHQLDLRGRCLDLRAAQAGFRQAGARKDMFIRFLFSALVDADRLDTERHFAPGDASVRETWPTLEELRERLAGYHRHLMARAAVTEVNRVRREVYEHCLEAAAQKPGIFRLTVPTGGGKTLSSLAFALEHAVRHGLRRVVVAVPYISVTEQTAAVYREALGEHALLEHHSSVALPEGDSSGLYDVLARLAAENWDAPLIVTTTVQLFESLFSNRPGACRKLHRLARSVIVIDEVQTLPPELLAPILDVLRGLTGTYGASVVLCTATQPAFDHERIPGLRGIREIVPGYAGHFATLKRVRFETEITPLTWAEVAQRMRGCRQALVVVNTRRDALALLDVLGDPEALHLSTLLCPAHRREVLAEIRKRLAAGQVCRVVSTQVVEAGVDLDFPVVMRAVGPLESLVQVAGRCNREGRLPSGTVYIFEPAEGALPPGVYRTAVAEALGFLRRGVDLHDPDVYRAYFARLYQSVDLDARRIQALRQHLDFPEVSARFHLIEDDAVPVVVRYGPDVASLLSTLRHHGPNRELLRRLQPFMVTLHRRRLEEAHRSGSVREACPGVYEWLGGYDAVRGLGVPGVDPGELIV